MHELGDRPISEDLRRTTLIADIQLLSIGESISLGSNREGKERSNYMYIHQIEEVGGLQGEYEGKGHGRASPRS